MNCAQIVVTSSSTRANHSPGFRARAGPRPLKTRQSVLTPLTALIAGVKEDQACQSPVLGTVQLPSNSPSGPSKRISMMPPALAEAARISNCSALGPKSTPS